MPLKPFNKITANGAQSNTLSATSKRLILKLSDYAELMQSSQVVKVSIVIRENIVLPLPTIQ